MADKINNTLLELAPLYLGTTPAITLVSLQYDDRFFGGEPIRSAPAASVFREGNRWVNINDPETIQPWHSHFGIFIPTGEDSRELINVNVNVNDQMTSLGLMERAVSLTILVGKHYDVPGQSPLIIESGDAPDILKGIFEAAHDRQREILKEVLAEPYLEAIGAKG